MLLAPVVSFLVVGMSSAAPDISEERADVRTSDKHACVDAVVPTIDIAPLRRFTPEELDDHWASGSLPADVRRTVDDLRTAGSEFGFFHVVGHGVDQDLLDQTHSLQRAFFASSRESKQPLKRTVDNLQGWDDGGYSGGQPDAMELLSSAYPPLSEARRRAYGERRLPPGDVLPGFESTYLQCSEAMLNDVAKALLRGLCMAMGEPPTRLDSLLDGDDHLSRAVMLYYPGRIQLDASDPTKMPARYASAKFGINAHVDSILFNVVYQQDTAGLQGCRPRLDVASAANEVEWFDLAPARGVFAVIIGAFMQVLSNELLMAGIHRVPLVNHTRHSLCVAQYRDSPRVHVQSSLTIFPSAHRAAHPLLLCVRCEAVH